jgi:uncharacterized sulfatase
MGRFEAEPQPYLHGFRGRMDERYDLVRSVRNQRYIYIRNYMPHLIYGQYIEYMFQTPTTRVWKQLYDEGKLKPPQTFFWEPKPPEELYDLETDPDEVKNLAQLPTHAAILKELRTAQQQHVLKIRDTGFLTEAEQHSRSAGSTIYELGHDLGKYPLEKILAMAELASMLKPEAVPQLVEGLKDSDSAVRYWAVMGLLMRGSQAVTGAGDGIRRALNDSSPSVRIAAASALGGFGNENDLPVVLSALKELAPPEKNGAYVSMLALNAIEALGKKAAPLLDLIKTIPTRDPSAPERANGYVARLVGDITGVQAPNERKGKKGARKNRGE